MPASVILLAAGRGRRFGSSSPKQFLRLSGEPLFMKPLRVFLKHARVREIVVVTLPREVKRLEKTLKKVKTRKRLVVAAGGRFRGESVKKGVEALHWLGNVLLVHDAARPFVSSDIVTRVERAAQQTGCSLAAWPLADTLKKEGQNQKVNKTIPRKNLWLAQTPQGFKKNVALQCLLRPSKKATDDVELAERKGYKVKIVLGGATNFKITTPHDWKVGQALLKK